MIANLFIIAFILLMAYWWGVQGAFSAFLHLVVVIVAGALALAVWEPFTLGVLMGFMPQLAWSVGLIGPFLFFLVAIRVAMDKIAPGNLIFSSLVNQIVGGVFGLLAGVLIAGFTIIGLGLLPFSPALGGYQPLVMEGGQVKQGHGGGLWVPVDEMTAGFFTSLSSAGGGGAFASSTPLGEYQPDLARQVLLLRMRPDPNASAVARPGSVHVDTIETAATPQEEIDSKIIEVLGADAKTAGHRLVVVDTSWNKDNGTFDSDSQVRVAPTQMQLVAFENGRGTMHTPVGFITIPQGGDQDRLFEPIDKPTAVAFSSLQQTQFGWVFLVPEDAEPRFLLARNIRFELNYKEAAEREASVLRVAMGVPGVALTAIADQPAGEPVVLELNGLLPAVVSKNVARDLSYNAQTEVTGGKMKVPKPKSQIGEGLAVKSIWAPPPQKMVRLRIKLAKARELFGIASSAAEREKGLFLEDDLGQVLKPIGYALHFKDRSMEVAVDRDATFTQAKQLPLPSMGAEDDLYLYYLCSPGVTINNVVVGLLQESGGTSVVIGKEEVETSSDVKVKIPAE